MSVDINDTATVLYGDNQAAIALSRDPKYHAQTKHIDIRYHYIIELINKAVVRLVYCPTKNMLADGLTKPLRGRRFKELFESIGIKRIDREKEK